MSEDAHDRLASACEGHRIVRKLHDVPPHEVYEVRVDGRRAVYKGNTGPTGRATTEGHVIAFVGERTGVSVPTVLHVGGEFFVAAWHPQVPSPEAEPSTTDAWIRAGGRGLARLHAETGPSVDGYGAVTPEDGGLTAPHDDWHDAAVAYLGDRRPVLAEHGHGDVVDAAVAALTERPDAFAGAGAPVVCHGWWTPEHVAVAGGEVVCAVDFEHALAAPAEYDYRRTALPTFADGDRQARFREAYESVRPLPEGIDRREPFFGLLCVVYYLESLYVQDQHGPEETARRAERLRESVRETLDDVG
jgi:fructosamine-3-kinase